MYTSKSMSPHYNFHRHTNRNVRATYVPQSARALILEQDYSRTNLDHVVDHAVDHAHFKNLSAFFVNLVTRASAWRTSPEGQADIAHGG